MMNENVLFQATDHDGAILSVCKLGDEQVKFVFGIEKDKVRSSRIWVGGAWLQRKDVSDLVYELVAWLNGGEDE